MSSCKVRFLWADNILETNVFSEFPCLSSALKFLNLAASCSSRVSLRRITCRPCGTTSLVRSSPLRDIPGRRMKVATAGSAWETPRPALRLSCSPRLLLAGGAAPSRAISGGSLCVAAGDCPGGPLPGVTCSCPGAGRLTISLGEFVVIENHQIPINKATARTAVE